MNDLSVLENSLKVSQKQNRQSFAQVTERILALSGEQSFDFDPTDPLRNLRRDYLELAYLLVQAQGGGGKKELREQVKNTTESLVVESIKFHLSFFRPSLLGVFERKVVTRLVREMKSIFAVKNADYGNAFRFWGIPGLVVRVGDKYLRLIQLTQKGYKRKVEGERVPDTALDLANYGIMLLMLLGEKRSLKWGE